MHERGQSKPSVSLRALIAGYANVITLDDKITIHNCFALFIVNLR